jgi:hypothetical protein
MSRENGFLQLRRGVFQHVRDGWLSPLQALCLIYMLTQADTRSGVWRGGAGALAGELSIPARTARRVLEALDECYIKRFAVAGRHECYPILLHKFLVTDGERSGQQLNALDSRSPQELRYFAREHRGEHDGEHMTTQKKLETRDRRIRQNPAAKTAPPPDSRFRIFHDSAYEAFRAKYGQPPTWGGKQHRSLQLFLADQPRVQLVEWQRRFMNYLESTEVFTRNQGGSLAYFVTHFDVFHAGPVVYRVGAGGLDGKPSGCNESFDERKRRQSAEAIGAARRCFDTLDGEVVGYLPSSRRN